MHRLFGITTSAVIVCDRFFALMKTFSVMPYHAFVNGQRGAPAHQVRTADLTAAIMRSRIGHPAAAWSFCCFLQKEVLQFLELCRVLRGQVIRQTKIGGDVVQLPSIVFERPLEP